MPHHHLGTSKRLPMAKRAEAGSAESFIGGIDRSSSTRASSSFDGCCGATG